MPTDSPCPLGCGLSGLHSTLDCATRRGVAWEGDAGGACAALRREVARLRIERDHLAARAAEYEADRDRNAELWTDVDAKLAAAEQECADQQREIDQLRDDVRHLEALLEDLRRDSSREIVRLRRECVRLRVMLDRYGSHQEDECMWTNDAGHCVCVCGLDAARAALHPEGAALAAEGKDEGEAKHEA